MMRKSTDANQREPSTTRQHGVTPNADDELPPGDHALEIAARRGIGPLSPLAREIWHGNAEPCVSCGQLVGRGATQCDHCDQDLSNEMIEKMRLHAGPWYVLEHVRPFPGVSLDRIVRQIRRDLLTETSIVRGPATDYQWRFALETPGLCRYFGRCWNCHQEVSPSDSQCRQCLSPLAFDGNRPKAIETSATPNHPPVTTEARQTPLSAMPSGDQLKELTAVLDGGEVPTHDPAWEAPPRVGRLSATWIAAALLIAAILALMWLAQLRSKDTTPTGPATVPTAVQATDE